MHTDPEVLGLLAVGEVAGTDDERAHVDSCPECSRELEELRHLVELGRSLGAESLGSDTLSRPSPEVWLRVREELHFESPPSSTPSDPAASAAARSASRAGTGQTSAAKSSPTIGQGTPLDRLGAAFGRLTGRLTSRLTGRLTRRSAGRAMSGSRPEELSARASLSAVDLGSRASATAELATDELGRRVLQLAIEADLASPEQIPTKTAGSEQAGSEPGPALRQAWLVHREDSGRRQSLGILDGRYGVWTIDHSIDLELYAILEISHQGTGNADHPGLPILRGELTLRD